MYSARQSSRDAGGGDWPLRRRRAGTRMRMPHRRRAESRPFARERGGAGEGGDPSPAARGAVDRRRRQEKQRGAKVKG